MEFNSEPIKNWFGFTRRERSSSFILLVLIILIVCIRYLIPDKSIDITEYASGFPLEDIASEKSDWNSESEKVPIFFDPNLVSADILIKAGFTSKEANTIISYRKKGGRFTYPGDIRKIYGIEDGKAEKIIPFIVIKQDTVSKYKNRNYEKIYVIIDLNTCDSAALVSLPGIGPVLSARILKYRHLLGGFVRIEQLKEVYGLSNETYEIIRERVSADSLAVQGINLNYADYKQLSGIIYFNKYEVMSILKFRELKGKIVNITELVDNKIITKEKAAKAGPYLRFEYKLYP
jgi:competence protein ComEA